MQRRVAAANQSKQEWTDKLLMKMHQDDQRVEQLQNENALKHTLQAEQNRWIVWITNINVTWFMLQIGAARARGAAG